MAAYIRKTLRLFKMRINMDKARRKETKWLFLILGLGLIVRLYFALNSPNPTIKDGVLYDSVAVSLNNGNGFSLDGEHPTSQVPPLYPYFLASVYAIFGHNFKAAL